MTNKYLEKIAEMSESEQRLHRDLSDSWHIFSQRKALRDNGYDDSFSTVGNLNAHANAEGSGHAIKSILGGAGIGGLIGAGVGALSGNARAGALMGGAAGTLVGSGYDAHNQLTKVYPDEVKKFILEKRFQKANE